MPALESKTIANYERLGDKNQIKTLYNTNGRM